MKTIIHKEPRNFDGVVIENAVKRLPDEKADHLVKNDGWEYCSKSVYKKVRDAVDQFDLGDLEERSINTIATHDEYVRIEKKIGHSFKKDQPISEIQKTINHGV
jgi:hypothetical protein